jgi:CheY-like chemotaxis protein
MSMQKGMFPDQNLKGVEPISNDERGKNASELLDDLGALNLSTAMEKVEGKPICQKGLSFFCGSVDGTAEIYRMWVAQSGGNLGLLETPEAMVEALLRFPGEVDFVMVDVDSFGDVGEAIDLCLYVRNASPDVPLILIASEVSADDFTAERMSACDATLRAPVSAGRMRAAIQAANQNNARYQAWREERWASERAEEAVENV